MVDEILLEKVVRVIKVGFSIFGIIIKEDL